MRGLIKATWLPLLLVLIFAIGAASFIWLGCLLISICFMLFSVIFILDTYGRGSDYCYLYRNKYKKEIYWELFSKTRCSREVMVAIDPRSKSYYELSGYKWYHILPDKLSDCFNPKFWMSLHKNRINKNKNPS